MENFKFTEQELKYVNDDIFNKENDVYATSLISDKYYIYATLPQGWYSFEVAEDEKMDCLNHLRQEGVNANITYTGIFVNIKKPRTIHILLSTDGEKIVKHLRSILVLQHKRLQQEQESLIQKDVKTRTDYGEEYNRESMYETAREQLLDCKKAVINGKCYDSLIGVMIEDCAMEQEKHEEYLKLAETYQQENDDEKSFEYFSKAWETGKVQDKLLKRSQCAVDKVKEYMEFKDKIRKAYKVNKNLKELSITQIESCLKLLNEYKSKLLESMYGDTVTNLTYSSYKTTQNFIKEIEQELAKRHANINL